MDINLFSVEIEKEGFSLRISGSFKLSKGNYSLTINWWADAYQITKKHESFILIDDIDFDSGNHIVNDIPIDSISEFRDHLKKIGMSTFATQLTIEEKLVVKAIEQVAKRCKIIKDTFGNLRYWFDLSKEERDLIEKEEKQ